MRGRKPKSADEKALSGNPGKRRPPAETPKQIFFADGTAAPMPPPWLNAGARAVWLAEIAGLKASTLILLPALRLFAMYCAAVERVERFSKVLDDKGETYETKTGFVRERPEVGLMKSAGNDVIKLSIELNISPKAWTASTSTQKREQLELFASGAAVDQPATQGQAAPAPDQLDEYIAGRPTSH